MENDSLPLWSDLCNGISYAGKTASLYWLRALFIMMSCWCMESRHQQAWYWPGCMEYSRVIILLSYWRTKSFCHLSPSCDITVTKMMESKLGGIKIEGVNKQLGSIKVNSIPQRLIELATTGVKTNKSYPSIHMNVCKSNLAIFHLRPGSLDNNGRDWQASFRKFLPTEISFVLFYWCIIKVNSTVTTDSWIDGLVPYISNTKPSLVLMLTISLQAPTGHKTTPKFPMVNARINRVTLA